MEPLVRCMKASQDMYVVRGKGEDLEKRAMSEKIRGSNVWQAIADLVYRIRRPYMTKIFITNQSK